MAVFEEARKDNFTAVPIKTPLNFSCFFIPENTSSNSKCYLILKVK